MTSSLTWHYLRCLMRYQLPTAVTVHIDPQVPRMLHRAGIASYPHGITIRPSHDGSVSEDADMILFDLKSLPLL
jgi:hypothetical protein